MKEKKILLLNDIEHENFKRIKKKVGNRNVATFYQIANIFSFTELQIFSMCYIERCFPIVCKKNNFRNLSFYLIEKIISSSELRIDSEMEVFNAINNWIRHDLKEKIKFSSKLLSKVRFNLISADALKSISESDEYFSKIDDCVSILTNALKNNKSSVKNKLSRYCTQSMYSIILSGGYINQLNDIIVSNATNEINARNFNNVKYINSLNNERIDHKSVYCKGAVYVFGGYDKNNQLVKYVESIL